MLNNYPLSEEDTMLNFLNIQFYNRFIKRGRKSMFRTAFFTIAIILFLPLHTNAEYLAPDLTVEQMSSPIPNYDLANNTTLKNLLESPSTGRSINTDGNLVDSDGNNVDDYFTDLQRYLATTDPEKYNLALALAVNRNLDRDADGHSDFVEYSS